VRPKKIMLLSSGELGKEFVIAVKRLGHYVIAVDSYNDAPAQQVADEREVIDMLNGKALDAIVAKHQPDLIVPEIEAIRTERFYDYEEQGIQVVPSARAANFTMNRKAIRDLASQELGLRTANYRYAASLEELRRAVAEVGTPCVVKPLMSSSGKGQSTVKSEADIEKAWSYSQSVILADKAGTNPQYIGVDEALREAGTDIRIFGKPVTRPYRRMGVALAHDQLGSDVTVVKEMAIANARKVTVVTE